MQGTKESIEQTSVQSPALSHRLSVWIGQYVRSFDNCPNANSLLNSKDGNIECDPRFPVYREVGNPSCLDFVQQVLHEQDLTTIDHAAISSPSLFCGHCCGPRTTAHPHRNRTPILRWQRPNSTNLPCHKRHHLRRLRCAHLLWSRWELPPLYRPRCQPGLGVRMLGR